MLGVIFVAHTVVGEVVTWTTRAKIVSQSIARQTTMARAVFNTCRLMSSEYCFLVIESVSGVKNLLIV